MNHTTRGIAAAILALGLVFSTGIIYATANSAYAGDNVRIKKAIKNHCWAVNSTDFTQCNQEFNANTLTQTQTPVTPVKLTCEQCFKKFLSSTQITLLLSAAGRLTSLEQLCAVLPTLTSEAGLESFLVNRLRVSESAAAQLIQCLKDAGVQFGEIK